MMIGALWQVSHQFIVWYMSPNIDSYCPQVFTVFGYSLERNLLSGASPSLAMLAGSCQLLLLMNNMPRHLSFNSFHFGAQPIMSAVTTAVAAHAFAAALKEYEENTETETDGEDGE